MSHTYPQTSVVIEEKHTHVQGRVLPTLLLLSCTIHSSKMIFYLYDMGSTEKKREKKDKKSIILDY